MTLYLDLPETNTKSTKDAIIQILSQKKLLTLKELTYEINTNFGLRTSSQATFKAIDSLIKSKIIEKINSTYQLDADWIKKIKEFANLLEENYPRKFCFAEHQWK